MSRRAWVYFIALGVIWGLPYFFIRVAVRELDPGTLIFLRTGLASLILVPFAIRRRQWGALRGHLLPFLGYTASEMAIPWLLLANAETKLGSSFAGLVIAIVPLLGAAIAVVLGTERLGRRRLFGLLLGIVGVVVLVGVDVHSSNVGAVFELLGCSVGYAIGPSLVSRKLSDVPTFEVVAGSVLLTALVYLPFGVTHLPSHLHAEVAWSLVALAVVCTAVAFMIFFALIKMIGPARAVVITYINPAVAILLGVLALNEPFTLGLAIGFPIILAGSVLGTWSPQHVSSPASAPAPSSGVTSEVALASAPLPDGKAPLS